MLLRIVGQVDGVYDVGATLAWIGEEGEEVPGEPAEQAQAPAAEQAIESRATPVALRLAQRHGIDAEALQGTGPGERVTKEDVQRAIDDGTAHSAKKHLARLQHLALQHSLRSRLQIVLRDRG